MKTSNYLILAAFAGLLFITGCATDDGVSPRIVDQELSGAALDNMKGPVRRAYRDNFDTYYTVVPDFEGGWDSNNPFALVWVPGGGEGNATHMGKASTFFNQYITATGQSIAAPVTMFFEVELAMAGITDIPDEVSYIAFDSKGNSIWFQSTSNTSVPMSPTRVNFFGTSDIIGGTGKFEGATGEVEYEGYFNPQDPQDAGVGDNGWIEF
jgi:hypothetical protein